MNVREELLKSRIDPHLTTRNLSALASRAAGEKLRVSGTASLSGGCWNRVLKVDFEGAHPSLVFKISPDREDEKITNEYHVHRRFQTVTAMRTPKPWLLDSSQKLIPGTVFVMELIPGRVMHSCFGFFTDGEQSRIIDTIASDTAGLHTISEPGFGSSALPPEERHQRWSDFWLPRFDEVLDELKESGLLEADFLGRIDAVRPEFPKALESVHRAVLTHYDIWAGNVIIDTDSPGAPAVSGYIDISGFFADYARELSFAELFGIADGAFYRRYAQQHEIDADFRLRASIYNLKMSLRHVKMYPDQGYYRGIAADCLAFIEAEV
jgi:fructosamine-3-kinase